MNQDTNNIISKIEALPDDENLYIPTTGGCYSHEWIKLDTDDLKLIALLAKGEDVVREFIAKVLANPKVFTGPGPVMTEAFKSMFNKELD